MADDYQAKRSAAMRDRIVYLTDQCETISAELKALEAAVDRAWALYDEGTDEALYEPYTTAHAAWMKAVCASPHDAYVDEISELRMELRDTKGSR